MGGVGESSAAVSATLAAIRLRDEPVRSVVMLQAQNDDDSVGTDADGVHQLMQVCALVHVRAHTHAQYDMSGVPTTTVMRPAVVPPGGALSLSAALDALTQSTQLDDDDRLDGVASMDSQTSRESALLPTSTSAHIHTVVFCENLFVNFCSRRHEHQLAVQQPSRIAVR